jgi:hypothetical protein
MLFHQTTKAILDSIIHYICDTTLVPTINVHSVEKINLILVLKLNKLENKGRLFDFSTLTEF